MKPFVGVFPKMLNAPRDEDIKEFLESADGRILMNSRCVICTVRSTGYFVTGSTVENHWRGAITGVCAEHAPNSEMIIGLLQAAVVREINLKNCISLTAQLYDPDTGKFLSGSLPAHEGCDHSRLIDGHHRWKHGLL